MAALLDDEIAQRAGEDDRTEMRALMKLMELDVEKCKQLKRLTPEDAILTPMHPIITGLVELGLNESKWAFSSMIVKLFIEFAAAMEDKPVAAGFQLDAMEVLARCQPLHHGFCCVGVSIIRFPIGRHGSVGKVLVFALSSQP
jgi:hypothetical protein